jgi:hypothetical protein
VKHTTDWTGPGALSAPVGIDLRKVFIGHARKLCQTRQVLHRGQVDDWRVEEAEPLEYSEVLERPDIGDLRVGEVEHLKRFKVLERANAK